jgi:hypothetical protein
MSLVLKEIRSFDCTITLKSVEELGKMKDIRGAIRECTGQLAKGGNLRRLLSPRSASARKTAPVAGVSGLRSRSQFAQPSGVLSRAGLTMPHPFH